ncbi:MAG: UDP-N-acetylmuramate dehydrogenase [Armatimonadaceae bacterium]
MKRETSLTIASDVPLAPRTSLGVGGNARFFAAAQTVAQVQEALHWATAENLPVFLLGGGSNLVVSDEGFPGLVLSLQIAGVSAQHESPDEVILEVGAGEDWDSLVRHTVERGWQGIECLAGIPGSVGATPVQNVGAYGQEVAETIVAVTAIDRRTGTVHEFSNTECGFSYRRSRFNGDDAGNWCITSVRFRLRPNTPASLRYADLQRYFADQPAPSLFAVYHAVREIRSRKGMVIRPDDPDSRSAGSFFKNPIVSAADWARIQASTSQAIPHWLQPDGSVKLAAAWLIEHSGFARGQAWGYAGLSTKHILALVNRGDATAAEIVSAACRVQQGVQAAWGIPLAPEPVFLGFPPDAPLPHLAVRAFC